MGLRNIFTDIKKEIHRKKGMSGPARKGYFRVADLKIHY